MGSSAPESNDNDRALYQTTNPLYTPTGTQSGAPAEAPRGRSESEGADKPLEVADVLPVAALSAEEEGKDGTSATNAPKDGDDGAEEPDEPEWANLPEHKKARLRKERSFRYQLLKTRVKISQENHFHRPSIHGDFESFERVLDGYKADAQLERKR